MKKQDEIDFFNYLINLAKQDNKDIGYFNPGRSVLEKFTMNSKRKYRILLKWSDKDIWDYGINICCGWFTPEAVEKFNKEK